MNSLEILLPLGLAVFATVVIVGFSLRYRKANDKNGDKLWITQ